MTRQRSQSEFETFFHRHEPVLRRALVSRYGIVTGREMTVNALSVGWQRFDQIKEMTNPAGYLFTVGKNSVPLGDSCEVLVDDLVSLSRDHPEPGNLRELAALVAVLSDSEREAVLLVHAFNYTVREAADILGLSPSTIHENANRALERLRIQVSTKER